MTTIPAQRTPVEFLALALDAIARNRGVGAGAQSSINQQRGTTMKTPTLAPEAPAYITINAASVALSSKPWPVRQLVEDGELRAVRFGALVLVSAYDVEQLGGVIA